MFETLTIARLVTNG